MLLYIDPGTGSMLFAILLGVVGALNYLLKMAWTKLKFIMSGGKKVTVDEEEIPFVFFSDDRRYWAVFEPICKEFSNRGIDVVYLTASPDDPVFDYNDEHIHPEFIGEGNKAFARLNFLKATMMIATTPGLDVYQWKRSKDVKWYTHVFHSDGDGRMYRMFALDYYDAILVARKEQEESARYLEALRGLPAKELPKGGIPYMEKMIERRKAAEPVVNEQKVVLMAPTWGNSSLFKRFGGKIIDELLKTDYHIIIRPHPQSFTSEKEMMDEFMKKYPPSDRLEWNRDADNFDVLNRSDIMISDYSGVIHDFALVYDKPVIYTELKIDKSPYDAWWSDEILWPEKALPMMGIELTEDNLENIGDLIKECLESEKLTESRRQLLDWYCFGEGAVKSVDYLVDKYNQLKAQ